MKESLELCIMRMNELGFSFLSLMESLYFLSLFESSIQCTFSPPLSATSNKQIVVVSSLPNLFHPILKQTLNYELESNRGASFLAG